MKEYTQGDGVKRRLLHDECVAVALAEAVAEAAAVAVTEAVAEADQSIHDQSIQDPSRSFSSRTGPSMYQTKC